MSGAQILFFAFGTEGKESTRTFLSDVPWDRVCWDRLFELARSHSLLPLLHSLLAEHGKIHCLPDKTRDGLKNAYYHSLAHGLRMQEAYGQVAHALERQGIPHLPLRGIQWADILYHNVALRPMSDVDVLVEARCGKDASRALEANGCARGAETGYHDHHIRFLCRGIVIELHTKLFIDPVTALFPDFDPKHSLGQIAPLCARPLAAVHYWMKPHPPAVWISDYMRLPAFDARSASRPLQHLLKRTDLLVQRARKGMLEPLFLGNQRPEAYWLRLFLGQWLRDLARARASALRLSRAVLHWQWQRTWERLGIG